MFGKSTMVSSVLVSMLLGASVPAAVADHAHHDHDHGTTTATAPAEEATPAATLSDDIPECAADPTVQACVDYVYPDESAVVDIEANCEMMPFMVACNVWEACENGDVTGDACDPFTVLASQCQDEGMSGMVGCAVYTPMCLNPDTVVAQCEGAGIARLPSTMPTQQAIIAACATHGMPGCEDCTGEGLSCLNTLESLQSVCNAHQMEICAEYNNLCAVNGDDLEHFCGDRDGEFLPPMRMYFHTGIRDIVLFRDFIPENGPEYFGAIVFCLAMGIIAGALRTWRTIIEAGERLARSKVLASDTQEVADQSVVAMPVSEVVPRLGHSVLSFVILTLDYALMLAAMTFNVGIFFAVVAGLTLGVLMFRHIGTRTVERMQARQMLDTGSNGKPIKRMSADSKGSSEVTVNIKSANAAKVNGVMDPTLTGSSVDPACCGS